MPAFERKPLTGSMWVPEVKSHPNAPDFGGKIKVPACTEEMEYTISVWDNRERKNNPKSPDYGIKLEDPAERMKVPNGGTEALRSEPPRAPTNTRVAEGDDIPW